MAHFGRVRQSSSVLRHKFPNNVSIICLYLWEEGIFLPEVHYLSRDKIPRIVHIDLVEEVSRRRGRDTIFGLNQSGQFGQSHGAVSISVELLDFSLYKGKEEGKP